MAEGYWARRYSRRRFGASAATGGAGLAALALAGCGDDDDKKPATTGTAAVSATAGASPTATAATATAIDPAKMTDAEFFKALSENPPRDWKDEEIKAGGTLVRLLNRTPTTLDFHTSVTGANQEIALPQYNGLVRLSTRQGMKTVYEADVEPDLASAWEIPDAKTLIFTLNPGVKFQNIAPLNGRPLTVDDIRFALMRAKTDAKSQHQYSFKALDKVEDVGGKVRITLSEPDSSMINVLAAWIARIMPPEIGSNPDVARQKAVGTGGFILEKSTPNVEYVFKKNPDYFKKDKQGRTLPYLDGYTVSMITDPATLNAVFSAGKADFHYTTASPLGTGNFSDLRAFAVKNPKVVIQKRVSINGTYAYVPHYDKAPFKDVRVRRAFSLAMDRKAILDGLFLGQGITSPYFPWPSLLDKKPTPADLGQWAANRDVKQAKQLLEAAGFANGLDVDLAWSYSQDDVVALAKQFGAEAGIRINLVKTVDQTAHVTAYTKKDWKDLIQVGRGANYPDPNEYLQYYLPGNAKNYGDVNDPDLSALNDRQRQLAGAERKAVLKQVWDRLNDQLYDAFIQPNADQMTFWQPWVKNFVEAAWGSNAGTGAGCHDVIWRSS